MCVHACGGSCAWALLVRVNAGALYGLGEQPRVPTLSSTLSETGLGVAVSIHRLASP